MVEPVHVSASLAGAQRRDPDTAPLDPADFPGCRAVHVPRDEIEDYEGRLEYWEARTETAMVVCETTRFHEQPSHQLAGLARLIAASRGSVIQACGTTALGKFDDRGRFEVLMQADQILYLDPPPAEELTPRVDVDRHDLPDVVLEVDHSTDARVRKLPLYEAWGFPEVWVDVPDVRSPSRPRSRLSGLTIHLLEGGRFRETRSSRAFPGWSAVEIHRALNEHTMSASTAAALHRVGDALGKSGNTAPDDDPWLRRHRSEGRAEGRAEAQLGAVMALLEERGVPTSAAFPTRLAELGEITDADMIRAALRCASETGFQELCAGRRRD